MPELRLCSCEPKYCTDSTSPPLLSPPLLLNPKLEFGAPLVTIAVLILVFAFLPMLTILSIGRTNNDRIQNENKWILFDGLSNLITLGAFSMLLVMYLAHQSVVLGQKRSKGCGKILRWIEHISMYDVSLFYQEKIEKKKKKNSLFGKH
jgi:hypothetical protein